MHSQSASALIHEAYQASVRKSQSFSELLRNFQEMLQKTKANVRKEDEERLKQFIDSIYIYDDKEESR